MKYFSKQTKLGLVTLSHDIEVHSVGGTAVRNYITPCQHASSEGVTHWFRSNFGGIKDTYRL